MELGGEERFCFMTNSFVGLIVYINEQGFPVGGQCFIVDGETVIL
jgi:hypothetical protein